MKSHDRPRLSSHRAEGPWTVRSLTAVLPVLALAALVGGVLVALVPGVRGEVVASTTRRLDPYVELYFADVRQARSCPTEAGGRRALVDARLDSNLDDAERIDWSVTVTAGRRTRTVNSSTPVASGATATIATTVQVPARARDYVVEVSLPGRDTELRVRCSREGAS